MTGHRPPWLPGHAQAEPPARAVAVLVEADVVVGRCEEARVLGEPRRDTDADLPPGAARVAAERHRISAAWRRQGRTRAGAKCLPQVRPCKGRQCAAVLE